MVSGAAFATGVNARGRMPTVAGFGLHARHRRVDRRMRRVREPMSMVALRVADAREPGLDQVHLRRSDEARDEDIGGPGENLVRRRHLLDHAVAHDGDAVGHGQRLELIVGDDDGRLGKAGEHFLDLPAHGLAQLDVEPGQRLVEQEAVGIADDGAGDRDALFLAFGNLARQAVENLVEMQEPRRPRCTRCCRSACVKPS